MLRDIGIVCCCFVIPIFVREGAKTFSKASGKFVFGLDMSKLIKLEVVGDDWSKGISLVILLVDGTPGLTWEKLAYPAALAGHGCPIENKVG